MSRFLTHSKIRLHSAIHVVRTRWKIRDRRQEKTQKTKDNPE